MECARFASAFLFSRRNNVIILSQSDINRVKPDMVFYKFSNRSMSWDICHGEFLTAKKSGTINKRELALHLMGFLGSWGMYCRQAPLLLNHHYLVHEDLIDILMNKKYDPLFGVNNLVDFKNNITLMYDAYDDISNYYKALGVSRVITLSSKIMLGVYGCVPAFDNKVNNALAILQCKNSTVFKTKLKLLNNYISNNPELDKFIKSELKKHPDYTYMRILDDFLWNYK